MRVRLLPALLLVVLPFALPSASAACEVVTAEQWPDVNYVTVCVLDQGSHDDTIQTFAHAYVLHASQALEADPAFAYSHVRSDQGSWTYDDGFTQQERTWTELGAGTFAGARGLVGTGAQSRVAQRDQTAPEGEGGDACSSFVGRSTCAGASGWLTVQDVASVGVGAYHQQTGTGADCRESLDVQVDAAVAFLPVSTGPQPCAAEIPALYEAAPFRDLPALP